MAALADTNVWLALCLSGHEYHPAAVAWLHRYWYSLATQKMASPKVWMDAYLAAFAIASGYRLVTIDLAFQQYGDLDLILLKPA